MVMHSPGILLATSIITMTTFSFQSFVRGATFVGALTVALAASAPRSHAQSEQDQIEVARSVIRVDRQAAIASTMQLTDEEAERFWPLYRQYRFDM
jgi:hypothetical protein